MFNIMVLQWRETPSNISWNSFKSYYMNESIFKRYVTTFIHERHIKYVDSMIGRILN